jgi:hypothetical protein
MDPGFELLVYGQGVHHGQAPPAAGDQAHVRDAGVERGDQHLAFIPGAVRGHHDRGGVCGKLTGSLMGPHFKAGVPTECPEGGSDRSPSHDHDEQGRDLCFEEDLDGSAGQARIVHDPLAELGIPSVFGGGRDPQHDRGGGTFTGEES